MIGQWLALLNDSRLAKLSLQYQETCLVQRRTACRPTQVGSDKYLYSSVEESQRRSEHAGVCVRTDDEHLVVAPKLVSRQRRQGAVADLCKDSRLKLSERLE